MTSDQHADTVILNADVRTADETRPRARAVAISGGRIAFTGDDAPARSRIGPATTVIDAAGRVVAPGFIDIHSHTDRGLFSDPGYRLFKNYLMQGITTVLTGNCGRCQVETGELLSRAEATGTAVNFAALIGHNYVRAQSGTPAGERRPDAAQLAAMTRMIGQAMRDGAFGVSSGLEYIPGVSSRTSELIECARTAALAGGIYATHMRSEGDGLLASVEEAIRVGRESGAAVQISHIKSDGACNWWKTAPVIAMIEAARADGVRVSVDQYPYLAFGWNPSIFVPPEHLADGRDALVSSYLPDPARRAVIRQGIADRISRYHDGDGDRVVVFDWTDSRGTRWAGKTLRQILLGRGLEPAVGALAELVLEMLPGEPAHGVLGCDISTSEAAVRSYLKLDYAAVCTDGFNQPWPAPCHPRSYGSFPRVLGEYVRDQQVISLDQALRKMTALPAGLLGLADRGVLRAGAWADVVMLDPATIADRATFASPAAPEGIELVLVNGVPVVDRRGAADGDGFLAGTDRDRRLPGRVLRGPGYCARDRPA